MIISLGNGLSPSDILGRQPADETVGQLNGRLRGIGLLLTPNLVGRGLLKVGRQPRQHLLERRHLLRDDQQLVLGCGELGICGLKSASFWLDIAVHLVELDDVDDPGTETGGGWKCGGN
jgi:hypothetical protein